jgi:hypothetical protein
MALRATERKRMTLNAERTTNFFRALAYVS